MLFYVTTSGYVRPEGDSRPNAVSTAELDATGAMRLVASVPIVHSPMYMRMHPRLPVLYVLERFIPGSRDAVTTAEDRKHNVVATYAVAQDGRLDFVKRTPSGGESPMHLFITDDGSHALIVNPGWPGDPDPPEGHVTVLALGDDGTELRLADSVRWNGPAPVWRRSRPKPYPHSVFLDPAHRRAFVPQLMTDLVLIYEFDRETGTLTPAFQPWVQVSTGAGPRHVAFHPGGRSFYVVNSRDATISVVDYQPEDGTAVVIQTVSNHPADFDGKKDGSHALVSLDGRFLYCSHRESNSIGIFAIDAETGELSPAGRAATGGASPRDFIFADEGRLMLVANQDSNEIATFAVDSETGGLNPTGHVLDVQGRPSCIVVGP